MQPNNAISKGKVGLQVSAPTSLYMLTTVCTTVAAHAHGARHTGLNRSRSGSGYNIIRASWWCKFEGSPAQLRRAHTRDYLSELVQASVSDGDQQVSQATAMSFIVKLGVLRIESAGTHTATAITSLPFYPRASWNCIDW